MEKIDNHLELALARLQEKYKLQPNIINLITPHIDQVQDIENMLFELKDERSLDVAIGQQLDGWGEILNQSRGGTTDDDYRALLYSKIAEYNSFGTIEEILSIVTLIVNPASIELVEYFPATIQIVVNNPDPIVVEEYIKFIIKKAILSGIALDSVVYTEDDSFRFDTVGKGFEEGLFAKTI